MTDPRNETTPGPAALGAPAGAATSSPRWETWLLAGILLLAAVVHFGLPPVVTFDSGHYQTYVDILEGRKGWDTWDIGRGPVFPLILRASRALFGRGPLGFLVTGAAGLLVIGALFWRLTRLLWPRDAVVRSIAFTAFAGLLFFNPILNGYFHTVLTEFVAATLACVAIALALWWMETPWERGTRLRFLLLAGALVLACPVAWLLKQIFVGVVLFPLALGALFSPRRTRQERALRWALAGSGAAAALASAVIFPSLLPKSAATTNAERTSQGVIGKMMVDGTAEVVQFDATLAAVGLAALPQKHLDPSDEAEAVRQLSTGGAVAACSRVGHLRGDATAQGVVVLCSGPHLSAKDSVRFVGGLLLHHPFRFAAGYFVAFLRLTGLLENPRWPSENLAIPLRGYRGSAVGNVYHMTPELHAGIQDMAVQVDPGLLVRWPIRLANAAHGLHTMLLLAVFPGFLAAALWRRRAARKPAGRASPSSLRALHLALLVLGTAAGHMAAHLAVDGVIDRYTVPVLVPLVGLLAVAAGAVAAALRPPART